MIDPCLKCGSRQTVVKAQARGLVNIFYNHYGSLESETHHSLKLDRSQVVRCTKCDSIRRDLRIIDGEMKFDDKNSLTTFRIAPV